MENKSEVHFSWESNLEMNYRKKTQIISNQLGKALELIAVTATRTIKDYTHPLKIFKNSVTELKNIKVPSLYEKVHYFFLTGNEVYLKASEMLKEGVEKDNKELIYRASRYIEEGNAWIAISMVRIIEALEEGQKREA